MKEPESSFSPEAIDALTGRDPGKLLPDEQRLIQDVYSLSRDYARENERSLERIWNRLAQDQEQPVSLQKQESGATGLFMEGKAMPQKDIYQELLQERREQGLDQEKEFSTLDSQPIKHAGRSRWRAVGMSAAVAVVALTILSWALLSAGLRHSPQTTNVAGTQKVQAIFHTGTLLCSFSDNNPKIPVVMQPTLDWSANGQIAATYYNLQTFSAQNCAAQSTSIPGIYTTASWSPDGKHLLVLGATAEVLDTSTGNVISSYPPTQSSTGTTRAQTQNAGISFMDSLSGGPNGPAIPSVTESIWSSDGTQVISAMQGPALNSAASVVVWNASTGALIRTAVTFGPDLQFIGLNSGLGQGAISPNGKYVAVQAANNSIEIWSIATGKQVSTIPYNQQQISALAWSPDSSSLALGLTNASDVQIWSVASGQLTTTFRDRDSANTFIGALAWSPDGKYLAESASDIHIWDVSQQKIVATFGQVAQNQWIATLTWSPDSSMLASTYNNDNKGGDRTQNTGDIWKLS